MNPFQIVDRWLGEGHLCFIALEVGATVTGIESAIALAWAASGAGADALKVQILSHDRLVGDPALEVAWTEADGMPRTGRMREVLARRALTPDQWRDLAAQTIKLGLALIATVDFAETLELAQKIGAYAIKVCSGDVTNLPWIAEVAQAGLPVLLDTGHATLGEIERAVDICLAAGNDRLCVHVNPSGYPARLRSINLRLITTLRQLFPTLTVGFSDHTPGRDMDIAAVALGVSMVEKTLTLDQAQSGPEHMFSLEPDEAGGFVQAIRDLEVALGHPRRILTDAERQARRAARRSPFARHDLLAADKVDDQDIEWRRPAGGIEPPEWPLFRGRRLARNLPAGQMLRPEDFL